MLVHKEGENKQESSKGIANVGGRIGNYLQYGCRPDEDICLVDYPRAGGKIS